MTMEASPADPRTTSPADMLDDIKATKWILSSSTTLCEPADPAGLPCPRHHHGDPGRAQPIALALERLLQLCPLSLDWGQQRTVLGVR